MGRTLTRGFLKWGEVGIQPEAGNNAGSPWDVGSGGLGDWLAGWTQLAPHGRAKMANPGWVGVRAEKFKVEKTLQKTPVWASFDFVCQKKNCNV